MIPAKLQWKSSLVPISPRFSQLHRHILSSFHSLPRAYNFCSSRRAGATEAQPWCTQEQKNLCTVRSEQDKQQDPWSKDPWGLECFIDCYLQGERSVLTLQPKRKPSTGAMLLSSHLGCILSTVPFWAASRPHVRMHEHKHIQYPNRAQFPCSFLYQSAQLWFSSIMLDSRLPSPFLRVAAHKTV